MDKNIPNIQWIEKVSKLMDSQFKIPGTEIRFGLDPIVGLVPFVGEATTFAISIGLLFTMAKHGVSRKVVILMILNVLVDLLIGSIPVAGDAFDFMFKANQKNIQLLKSHYEEGKHQGSGKGILWLIILFLVAGIALIGYGIFVLSRWIINLF